ncbi:MAG TPA: hypothetical protein VM577_02130 [Anaerovoracaceae bacterium]|nr:hypothetical protein [Anaerovoracaceae bacterium]
MNKDEAILRLLSEVFDLRDQNAELKESSNYWYGEYQKLETKYRVDTKVMESNDDISLTPEGVANKCRMTTV